MKSRMMNAALMIGVAVLFAACGGSSGGSSPSGGVASTTISGTAAGGAPLVGTVTVKDSKGTEKSKAVDLAAAGAYSIDVTGLTPPFVLRADGTVGGTSVTYFSGTASVTTNGDVTVNITPFTDLIIGNVAGQIAENFYYKSPNFGALTAGALQQAQDELRNRLLPALQREGLDNTIDFLRASFKADGKGIDAVLDTVRVTPDPNNPNTKVLIHDAISGQEILDDLASKADTSQLNVSGTTRAQVTDFQQITNGFKTMESLFATSIPAANNAQLLALFDTQTFRHDGINFDEFTSFLLTAQNLGIKFSFTLVSLTPPDAPTNAKIKLTISQKNRIPETEEWQLNKVTVNNVSTWRAVGNQWIAGADVQAHASNSFSITTTGLWFGGTDVPPGSTIDYAVVTGKGLDNKGGRDGVSQGLLLVNYRNGASMGVATPPYQGATTLVRNQVRYNVLPLTDQEISTFVDNEIYTVIFYDDNNTPNNFADDIPMNGSGYQITLVKRPYLSSELASVFPTFTSPTFANLTTVGLNGGNLTITWILPAGRLASSVEFVRGTVPTGGGSTTFDFVDVDLETTAVTTSFTVSPPGAGQTVQSTSLSLETQDSFGRVFEVVVAP